MLKLNTKQHRQPIGGHHYASHGIMFRADTFPELVEKLRKFRLMNALPMGEPEQDVLLSYAIHFPYMVVSDGNPTPSTVTDEFAEWRSWVTRTWANPPTKFITTKEAKLRWEVCKDCPFNRKANWTETDEAAELKRRVYVMRRGLDIPDYIHHCALHRADLSVLVFIEDAHKFTAKKDGEQPGACWVGSLGGMQK